MSDGVTGVVVTGDPPVNDTAPGILMRDDSARQAITRVAFQGERGAYSEEAVIELFGERCAPVPRPTFDEVFAAIDEGAADLLLVPLENSLAGPVRRVHKLLAASFLRIIDEIELPISHCLIGCRGATLDLIETVESHPMALRQCERFFAAHPRITRREANDTAASARRVVEANDPTRAAIASRRAAEIYGGIILRERLEDARDNRTRFALLSPTQQQS